MIRSGGNYADTGGFVLNRVVGNHTAEFFDDALITLRYSLNLAAGHGLVFNVGEPVLGTTTPRC